MPEVRRDTYGWVFCEHANECPLRCPCPVRCICRYEGSCRAYLPDGSQVPSSRPPPPEHCFHHEEECPEGGCPCDNDCICWHLRVCHPKRTIATPDKKTAYDWIMQDDDDPV